MPEIKWEKVNNSTRQGFVGDYHLFTVVEDFTGCDLMPQFLGYDSKNDKRMPGGIRCSGFIEAKRKAKELLNNFIEDLTNA